MINDNSAKSNYELMNFLSNYGIGTQLHYLPIHLQPYYKKIGFKKNNFPNAEYYSKKALSIPIHVHLSFDDVDFITNKISQFF